LWARGLEPDVGHGGVDLGTGLGAAVLGLAGLDAGVSGAGLDGLAVHKLGGVNLILKVGLEQGLDGRLVLRGLQVTGGDLANKSSHAFLLFQLKDADEKNIRGWLLGGTSGSGAREATDKKTGLGDSQETEGAEGTGNGAAGKGDTGQTEGGGREGGDGEGGRAHGDGGKSNGAAQQTKASNWQESSHSNAVLVKLGCRL